MDTLQRIPEPKKKTSNSNHPQKRRSLLTKRKLKESCKHILSFMLAFAIFTETNFSAYASTSTLPLSTSSNTTKESDASKETDTDTDIDIDTDFGIDTGIDTDTTTDTDNTTNTGTDTATTPTYPYYRPVVDTEDLPDTAEMDSEELAEILSSGANRIEDFDPDAATPIPLDIVKYSLEHQDDVQETEVPEIEDADSDIDPQSVVVLSAMVAGLMCVWWACYSSGLGIDSLSMLADQINSRIQASKNFSFSCLKNNVLISAELSPSDFQHLADVLENSKTSNGYSVSLSETDKLALLACMKISNIDTTVFDISNFKLEPVEGYKYYYPMPTMSYYSSYSASCEFLFTNSPVAFAVHSSNSFVDTRLYRANAALAEFGYEQMDYAVATYKLSNQTGFYHFDSIKKYENGITTGLQNYFKALPFPILPNLSDSYKNYYLTGSGLLLRSDYQKCISLNQLLNSDTFTLNGDIDSAVNSAKNIYSVTTGVATSAGVVTGSSSSTAIPDSGTTTVPDTSTGTGGSTSGSGEGSGNYTNILTQIAGNIAAIVGSVALLQNILTTLNDLPGTLAQKIATAIDNSILAGIVRSIKEAIESIQDWDIESWLIDCANEISDTIDSAISRIINRLSDFPTADALAGIIINALSGSALTTAVTSIKSMLEKGNLISFGQSYTDALTNVLNSLGVGTLSTLLQTISTNVQTGFGEVVGKVGTLEDVLSGLSSGITLEDLTNALENLLNVLGVGSLAGILSGILEVVSGMSIASVIDAIRALPAAIANAIAIDDSEENSEENKNDSGFGNFLNLFMIALLIIILLIILFINCLRFIVLVFNIPASSTLIHEDMLKGIEFMQNLQIPVFNISLYSLLLACAYFVIFMTVIAAIRRKIDKLHV